MNTKYIISLFTMLFSCIYTIGQTTQGYIINVENGQVYVDLTNAQVMPGDQLNIIINGGYMTHPITGRRVKKENEVLGILEIGNTYTEYSVALPTESSLLPKLKKGMAVQIIARKETVIPSPQSKQESESLLSEELVPQQEPIYTHSSTSLQIENNMKTPIVIASAVVNDVVNNGHFGGYVADVLMEQMLLCDKVRLLDRSILNAQIDEINLSGDILDANTTIKRDKGIGARYILQTTMQKPDVANIRTGIPLASIMGAVQGLTGTNIGAGYASNAQVATLKASVNISVRVIDLQTSEIVFMCSGSGKSQGKSQLSLEYGALGGGELNGGAEGFKQTVTGKAIQQAFIKIGKNLKDFFSGRTERKVMGSVSGGISYGDKMYAKGYKLYLGTQRLNKEDIANTFSEYPDLYFQYKQAKKKKRWSWWIGIGIPLTTSAFLGAEASDTSGATPFYIGMAIASWGGIIWGVMMNKSGRKKVRQIITSYNNSNTQYSYKTPSTSQCSLSLTPTGIRFTF